MAAELLRIELRRGPGIWAAVVSVALFYVALHRYGAILTWMDATSAIGASTQLCGPVAAGIAAYCGSRAVRRKTIDQHQLATRPELATTGSELGAYAIWVVGTWLLATLVTLIVVWHNCHWGSPNAVWMAAAGAGLLAEITAGYLFGRLAPYLVTPPVVAVVLFFATGLLLNHANNWWYFLSPLNSQDWLPFDGLHTTNFVLQTVFLLGAVVVCVAGAAIRFSRSERTTTATLGTGLAMVIVAVAGLASGDGRFWAIDTRIEWKCLGSQPAVCIHPAFVSVETPLRQQFDAVAQRIAGTAFQVNRFEQRPRGIGSQPTPGAIAFAIDVPVTAAVPDAVVGATVSLLGADSCQTAPKLSSARVEQAIIEWVSGQTVLGPDQSVADPPADALVSQFNALTDQGKRSWLTQHADGIRSCSLVSTERR
ncbi:MAG: hypothetical protein ACR2IK_25455 [Chloroflexota bacterium]